MSISKGTIKAQRIRAVRVCTYREDPEIVILEIEGAAKKHHFILPRTELQRLADRLTLDAVILAPFAVVGTT